MEGKTKQATAMVAVFLMICAGLIPAISASYEGMDENIFVEDLSVDENHPAYYNVTRYDLRGFTYSKETIKVSYEDAMVMKQELEHLESLPDTTERNWRRNALFFNNDLLSEKRCNLFSRVVEFGNNNFDYNSPFRDYGDSIDLFLANIDGTLGRSFINLFNFFSGAPIFLSIARGVDLQLSSFGVPYHFQTENITRIFVIGLIGEIWVLPFFSPTGYINALALFGSITELE